MEFSAVDYQYHRHDAPDTEATFASKLMKVREKEGRCINKNCGIYTHRIKRRYLFLKKKVPLNVKGQVLDGRCLLCNPLRCDLEDERSCYSAPMMGSKENDFNLLTSTNSTDSNSAYMSSSMSDQLSVGSAPSKMHHFLNRTSPRNAQIAPSSLNDDHPHRHSKAFHYSLPTDLMIQPLSELGTTHSLSSGSRSSSRRRKRSRSVEVLNSMNTDSEVEVISMCSSSDSDSPRSCDSFGPSSQCPPKLICVDAHGSHLTYQNRFRGVSRSFRRFLSRKK